MQRKRGATSCACTRRALAWVQVGSLERRGLDPLMWPRNAGSYPGFVFTDAPLSLAAGHFGLGHGSGAHAPDE